MRDRGRHLPGVLHTHTREGVDESSGRGYEQRDENGYNYSNGDGSGSGSGNGNGNERTGTGI